MLLLITKTLPTYSNAALYYETTSCKIAYHRLQFPKYPEFQLCELVFFQKNCVNWFSCHRIELMLTEFNDKNYFLDSFFFLPELERLQKEEPSITKSMRWHCPPEVHTTSPFSLFDGMIQYLSEKRSSELEKKKIIKSM